METAYYSLFLAALLYASASCENICIQYCDGRDPNLAVNPRSPVSTSVWSREIRLHISDQDNMAYGSITNGDPGDQLWLDRSFDGGQTWESGSRLGDTVIPPGARETKTLLYNVDGSYEQLQIGALRACGKANNRDEIACTAWARSTVHADTPMEAAATALMQFYDNGGSWNNLWWNGANCFQAVLDYMVLTGDRTYMYIVDTTYEKNKNKQWGNFTNDYIDDVGWWALAWVRAFDLTGNAKYLEMAKFDADYMYATADDRCGGGIYWTVRLDHKNAIPNELYIKLAASLHNRIPGDTKYLSQALAVWEWFNNVGVINNENLVNDGINTYGDCKNNGDVTWTYNQGVILGGLIELWKASGDIKYISRARQIADAVIASSYLSPNGILTEPCERDSDCGDDGPSFKGVFMRNLGELNRVIDDRPYSNYLESNANVVYANRNELNQYGLRYAGPFDRAEPRRQHSAFEVFTATVR